MKLKMMMEDSTRQFPDFSHLSEEDRDLMDPVGPVHTSVVTPAKHTEISQLLLGSAVKISPELQFSKFMVGRNEYRAKPCGENQLLYRWEGNHWSKCSDTTGQKMAWTWLKSNSPKEATVKKAQSLFQSALLDLPELPGLPKASVIPLTNVWLVVQDDGQYQIQKPDMGWGITYQVNASLKITSEQTRYEPSIVRQDSLFAKFLQVSLPDKQVRQLVQEYCGYTLLNDVRFQCCQVWVGNGRNGKSVLMKIMEQLHAKVGTVNLDELSGFGLSALVDSSLIVCPETPKRGIDEQTFKRIVSGDSVSISYKYKDAFRYNPMAKLIVACNRFPHFTDDSNGVWRRIQLVNWSVEVAQEQEVANLDQKIIDGELDQVVNWCLEGLSRLLKRGDFDVPQSAQLHKGQERVNSNNILGFIEDYGLKMDSTAQIEKSKVYEKYGEFCDAQGMTPFQGNEFWKRIKGQFSGLVESKKTVRNVRVRMVNLVFDVSNDDSVNDIPVFDGEKEGRHE
jgi:putative DNA primase/helicase